MVVKIPNVLVANQNYFKRSTNFQYDKILHIGSASEDECKGLPNLKKNKCYYFHYSGDSFVYHISSILYEEQNEIELILTLGNRFKIPEKVNKVELNETSFIYTPLYKFGMQQILPGLLIQQNPPCFSRFKEKNTQTV